MSSFHLILPDMFHERYDVEEKLFGKFWFSSHEESFQEPSPLPNQFIDGVLGETDRVAEVDRSYLVQFSFLEHLIQNLCKEQLNGITILYSIVLSALKIESSLHTNTVTPNIIQTSIAYSSSSSIEYLYSASGALKPQKRYLLPLH